MIRHMYYNQRHLHPSLAAKKEEYRCSLGTTTTAAAAPSANDRNSTKMAVRAVCVCGRTFSYKQNLTYHKKWECGRILMCNICQKSFKVKSHLLKHLRECHQQMLDIKDANLRS